MYLRLDSQTQEISSDRVFKDRKPELASGLKVFGLCLLILTSCFTALAFGCVRSHLRHYWKICTADSSASTDKTAKIFRKSSGEHELTPILSDTQLSIILKNKNNFLDQNGKPSKDSIYKYINGFRDESGRPLEIEVEDYKSYFQEILESAKSERIKPSIQGGYSFETSLEGETDRTLFPFDHLLKDPINLENFLSLPQECQVYIQTAATENYSDITEIQQFELIKREQNLLNTLNEEARRFFKICMMKANSQNGVSKGFIHFRTAPVGKPIERIYIQMNKNHSHELLKIILEDVGRHPGVLDIKISGPQSAGRTDGIVIYIGSPSKEADETLATKQASKDRDSVLNQLIKIQKEHPHLFNGREIPFKKSGVPGIATIPGLSTSDSFTEKLSQAIAYSLNFTTTETSISPFRESIIDAYTHESWL
jgi:hypothetical protein